MHTVYIGKCMYMCAPLGYKIFLVDWNLSLTTSVLNHHMTHKAVRVEGSGAI